MYEDRTYGAIELINKKGGEWTVNDANVLESLAKILGHSLEMAIAQQKL
jgi:GAF domain-containing protein